MFQHKTGFYKTAFSRMYNCHKLLYYEEHHTWKAAADREVQLKRFRRDWKMQMIRRRNEGMRDLSEGWEGTS
jgi:putative endonuclease